MDATLLLQRAGTVSRPPGLAMLWVLLLCTLMAQCASAATTTTNSTITSSPLGEGRNGSSGDAGGGYTGGVEHTIHVLALEFEAVKEPLIFTVVVLLAGLSKIGKHLCLPLFVCLEKLTGEMTDCSNILSSLKLAAVCYIVLW